MRVLSAFRYFAAALALLTQAAGSRAMADTYGDEQARWINQRGTELWGPAPPKCDDLTFARRAFLDLIGRVPSIAELSDFEAMGDDRRKTLIETLVFGEGSRGVDYSRLTSEHLARQWRRVLLPAATSEAAATAIETWLARQFRDAVPYDQWTRSLVALEDADGGAGNQFYQAAGGLPEAYAGTLSRALLGIRIECAQCHDHPFASWKQQDFWGLAAFYADTARPVGELTSRRGSAAGEIAYEGVSYSAKFLWSEIPEPGGGLAPRSRLAQWLTSKDNPHFSTTAVNRFWQHLVGRGLYADVENLDTAGADERKFVDELGQRFAADGFRIRPLIAAILKSDWYQAESVAAVSFAGISEDHGTGQDRFYRPTKSVSPEQVFDSLEQSLHLPVSRLDPRAPRWSGIRRQWVNRLSESVGETPEDYSAGIPQALLLMNGNLTQDAVDLDRSRLLRAIIEAPFMAENQRIETLYLAVLTRRPAAEEMAAITELHEAARTESSENRFLAELLWALINSPEFVLCR